MNNSRRKNSRRLPWKEFLLTIISVILAPIGWKIVEYAWDSWDREVDLIITVEYDEERGELEVSLFNEERSLQLENIEVYYVQSGLDREYILDRKPVIFPDERRGTNDDLELDEIGKKLYEKGKIISEKENSFEYLLNLTLGIRCNLCENEEAHIEYLPSREGITDIIFCDKNLFGKDKNILYIDDCEPA